MTENERRSKLHLAPPRQKNCTLSFSFSLSTSSSLSKASTSQFATASWKATCHLTRCFQIVLKDWEPLQIRSKNKGRCMLVMPACLSAKLLYRQHHSSRGDVQEDSLSCAATLWMVIVANAFCSKQEICFHKSLCSKSSYEAHPVWSSRKWSTVFWLSDQMWRDPQWR